MGLGRCVWIYGRRLTRIVRGCQDEPAGCAMFPIKGGGGLGDDDEIPDDFGDDDDGNSEDHNG